MPKREPGRRYAHAGADASAFSEEDLGDIFGNMFREAREAEARAPRRGRDEHYSLTVAFLDAVNGATRRLTLPDGRTLEVKIPPGTTEGQVMRLRGQGGQGRNGGPAGDALIEIQVLPHRYFQRDGQDIRLTLPVTLQEAVIGGDVDVPTPRGTVIMRVPPRSDSGTELRLRGRGVPAHDGLEAGNLYAKLNVVLGKPDDALEQFLANWKPEHAGQSPARHEGAAMITIDVLVAQVSGLSRDDLERWISNEWVRPDRQAGGYVFREIDVARVRLIREMRDEMEVNEAALPVVLSLLDQLYDLRRHMRDFHEAFTRAAPEDVRRKVAEHLAGRGEGKGEG